MKRVLTAVGAGVCLFASAASAQTPPVMKNGLWETSMVQQQVGPKATVVQICVDDAYSRANNVLSSTVRKNNKCRASSVQRTPTGWSSTSTCEFGGTVRTSRVDIVGDFNSRYTMTLRSPPTAPPVTTATSVYKGPCKPGQRGGDMTINGRTFNTLDMMSK
jgi:hypothetical protein